MNQIITISPNKHIRMDVECKYLPEEGDVNLPERVDTAQIFISGDATAALEWAAVQGDEVFNEIERLCIQEINNE